MSRYLILLLINLPLISVAMFRAFVSFKLGRVSRRRFFVEIVFWTIVLVGLASAEPIYQWLFTKELTQTEPLSLFDVVQITAIIGLISLVLRNRQRIEQLEEKLKKLNTEVSIKISELQK